MTPGVAPPGPDLPPGSHVLPGGVAVSRLRVYDWPAADGACGGTPHLHTVAAEGYLVTAGSGRVETLSREGLASTPLEPGVLAWFGPGTVHRLVDGGGLEITTLMGDAGLPEAGDAVLTLPDEDLEPDRYGALVRLPTGVAEEEVAAAARRRRDLALRGWAVLRAEVAAGRPQALERLHERAAAIVRPHLPAWRETWRAGALARALASGEHLDALERGDVAHLGREPLQHRRPAPGPERFGMCGRLTTWPAT